MLQTRTIHFHFYLIGENNYAGGKGESSFSNTGLRTESGLRTEKKGG